jgi:acetylornithine deacetylase/succinyl-diaminopimelate desuccinylase-like protein
MPRIALVLETEEESGSSSLVKLLDLAKDVIQKPDILICMDSGCLDYEQLWMTSSLRGIAMVDFSVEFGKVGYHSGETGGMIPETFRILRTILDKLDNNITGVVTKELQVEVPEFKREEAKFIAGKYGDKLYTKYNVVEGGKFVEQDNLEELYLNNVWRPNLSITGAEGLPPIATAGNVLRPKTSVRCSMRLCPKFNAEEARKIMVKIITENVPYNAKVEITGSNVGSGWCMNELEPWFLKSIQ